MQLHGATVLERIDDVTANEQMDETMSPKRQLRRLREMEATRYHSQEAREGLWRTQVSVAEETKPTTRHETTALGRVDDITTTKQMCVMKSMGEPLCQMRLSQEGGHIRATMSRGGR